MRSFVAIPLEGDTIRRLKELQEGPDGIRWQDPANMHLTLKFLGDLPGERLDRLAALLSGLRHPSFDMTLAGVGAFPDPSRPKVIWAGVNPHPALMELQREVESAAGEVGVEREEREYRPHVTLGRVERAPAGEVDRYLERHDDWGIKKIPVRSFLLYTSRLESDGAIHSVRDRFRLGEAGADGP